MDRLTIQEIIDHCDRQLERERVGTIFYREHEAVKAYLEELQQYRDIGYVDQLQELVQAERDGKIAWAVRGEWRKITTTGTDMFGAPTVVVIACNCSVCGLDGREETDFCPHCGAIMKGGKLMDTRGKLVELLERSVFFSCERRADYLISCGVTVQTSGLPKGRWIDNCDSYLCSNCGYETDNPNRNPCGAGKCPNCGKEMEG